MIALAFAALIGGATQTVVLPETPAAPSQALPATASSPQIKTPDPATLPSNGRLVARPSSAPVVRSTPPIVPKASAEGGTSSSSSAALNTRDRKALPTAAAQASGGLPPGVSGGPVYGGSPSIQTGGSTPPAR